MTGQPRSPLIFCLSLLGPQVHQNLWHPTYWFFEYYQKGSLSDVSVTRRMLLNKKRNVFDGVSSPLSCGDALQGEVSIEKDSIFFFFFPDSTTKLTFSL